MNFSYITSLFYLTLGVLIFLLGWVILKENVRQRINRITGFMMFFAGTGPIFAAIGLLIRVSPNIQMDLAPLGKFFLVWEFFFPQMLLFSFYFPKEIAWIKRNVKWTVLIYLPHLVHFLIVFIFSSSEQIQNLLPLDAFADKFGLIVQPLVIIARFFLSILSLIYNFHANFFALINLFYIITAIALMMNSYKHLKNLRLKKQVGLVLWGIRASVGLYAIAFIFPRLNLFHFSQNMSYLLTTVALLIGASAIAWAIIRYQFLDIRLIIRRGLVFSLTSTILIAGYLLVYKHGKQLIENLLGIELPVLEILFLIIALLLFQPVLASLENLLDRIFSRDKLDYRNVLRHFSHELMTTLKREELIQKIQSLVQEVLSVEASHLFTLQPDELSFAIQDNPDQQLMPSGDLKQLLIEMDGPIGFDALTLRCHDDASLSFLRKIHAYLIIPFVYRNQLMGILILTEKIAKTGFSTEDTMLLSVMANQAAIAIENTRLYDAEIEKQRMEEEIRLAKGIQEHLLPSYFPNSDMFELAAFNLPSKDVGGDYYDFVQLDEDKIGIAIGDISGKGIPAAILMSNLQAALRISATRTHCTHDVMHEVNNQITRTTDSEKFATFFYGVLNSNNLMFEYTNAGHNYPILWRKGRKPMFLKEGGFIVGVMENAPYASATIGLEPEDILVFYTDGVTEAMNQNDEEYGEERLIQTLEANTHLPANEMIDEIIQSVCDFSDQALQYDDVTLVVLKTNKL